ncbi:hypothetical protein NLX83_15480 [Allokutzneria sp. A3M-2-11 16]|uniref:hypothetical protein n=1 Tax=Allokutzneria sp. A3M-2-11 16 TaxID=2962043 RepID=UPI0020B7A4C9|nr:hypothetical protein [Allokutzneria sp. A3M-2-11 16]MCP3800668.1 hypothetical protein [Allokutzneria sp. A3M-2-11 16]
MAVTRYAALVDPGEFIGRRIWVQNGMEPRIRDVDCAETISVDYYPPGETRDEFSLTYQPFAFFAALEAMQAAGKAWCELHGSPEEAAAQWGLQPYESVHDELAGVVGLRKLGPSVRRLLSELASAQDGHGVFLDAADLARSLVRCAEADAETTATGVSEGPE